MTNALPGVNIACVKKIVMTEKEIIIINCFFENLFQSDKIVIA